jgi:pilus assembly protein Flp/PilA
MRHDFQGYHRVYNLRFRKLYKIGGICKNPQDGNRMKKLRKREEGQGLVEYALLVLVAVVVIVILSQMGPAIGNIFSTIVGALDGSSSPSDLASECIGDLAPPTEYYLFEGGDPVIANPASYYSDSDCSKPAAGSNPITVINSSVSQADADQICQDLYSVNANANVPGDIWYCS